MDLSYSQSLLFYKHKSGPLGPVLQPVLAVLQTQASTTIPQTPERERDRQTDRDRERQRQIDRDRQRQTETERQRQRETERGREKETERDSDTDTERQRETERDRGPNAKYVNRYWSLKSLAILVL